MLPPTQNVAITPTGVGDGTYPNSTSNHSFPIFLTKEAVLQNWVLGLSLRTVKEEHVQI